MTDKYTFLFPILENQCKITLNKLCEARKLSNR